MMLSWIAVALAAGLVFLHEEHAQGVRFGTERSDEACAAEVVRDRGCSAVGSAGAAIWWLALLPLWRRRG